jgi:hypothetical protein
MSVLKCNCHGSAYEHHYLLYKRTICCSTYEHWNYEQPVHTEKGLLKILLLFWLKKLTKSAQTNLYNCIYLHPQMYLYDWNEFNRKLFCANVASKKCCLKNLCLWQWNTIRAKVYYWKGTCARMSFEYNVLLCHFQIKL